MNIVNIFRKVYNEQKFVRTKAVVFLRATYSHCRCQTRKLGYMYQCTEVDVPKWTRKCTQVVHNVAK